MTAFFFFSSCPSVTKKKEKNQSGAGPGIPRRLALVPQPHGSIIILNIAAFYDISIAGLKIDIENLGKIFPCQ